MAKCALLQGCCYRETETERQRDRETETQTQTQTQRQTQTQTQTQSRREHAQQCDQIFLLASQNRLNLIEPILLSVDVFTPPPSFSA
jgi:vacuolar-type H+-ATPase subunit E/Vma4